jgi:hypothetical protein
MGASTDRASLYVFIADAEADQKGFRLERGGGLDVRALRMGAWYAVNLKSAGILTRSLS